jgi:hypothetical protein
MVEETTTPSSLAFDCLTLFEVMMAIKEGEGKTDGSGQRMNGWSVRT